MRATEIIRNILNTIDDIERREETSVRLSITPILPDNDIAMLDNHWQENRYLQIKDLLSNDEDNLDGFSNTPVPKISDLESVIMSGDDVNKSKHPADIRTNAPSMYPNFQAKE